MMIKICKGSDRFPKYQKFVAFSTYQMIEIIDKGCEFLRLEHQDGSVQKRS